MWNPILVQWFKKIFSVNRDFEILFVIRDGNNLPPPRALSIASVLHDPWISRGCNRNLRESDWIEVWRMKTAPPPFSENSHVDPRFQSEKFSFSFRRSWEVDMDRKVAVISVRTLLTYKILILVCIHLDQIVFNRIISSWKSAAWKSPGGETLQPHVTGYK